MTVPPPAGPVDEPRDARAGLADPAAEVIDHAAVIRDDELLTAISSAPAVDALTWDDQPLTPSEPAADGDDAPDDPPDVAIALLAALRVDVDSTDRVGPSARGGTEGALHLL